MSDAPAARPQFRSDLSQTPLPEVLATVYRYKVPGVIECTRDEVVKRIYIDAGNIIFATSTDSAESLGNRLLSQGRITREQYEASLRMIGAGGKRHGTILVEMKAIDPKDLFLAVRDQVQAIVWSIFEWQSGLVTFQPGRDKHREFIKLDVPIHHAILAGVRHADPKALVTRIGPRTTLLEPSPGASRAEISLTLSSEEEALLGRVDGKRYLSDLTALPPLPAAENAQLLYAFLTLKLIRRKAPKQIKVRVRSS